MKKYYYDLHIHSCLSPCGDEDNTPGNIVGMAKLCGLNILALTDHNSCKNCPAFFEAAKRHGIIPIAGMELTTSEDIHVVCLFEHLKDALAFDEYVDSRRNKIKNRPEIFGNQTVLDGDDNELYQVDDLLINASSISINDVRATVESYGGICYPAHIDRESNGIIAVLGTLPEDISFNYYELHDGGRTGVFSSRFAIPTDRFIISSDSHYLTDMRDADAYLEIEDEFCSDEHIRKRIFEILRRPL